MCKSEAQRQKKLAKRQRKSKAKHSTILARKQQLGSLMGMMRAANRGEIIACERGYLGCSGEENGMIPVVVRRQGPGGSVAIATFLVDLWCLGVKDCHGELLSPQGAREKLSYLEDRIDLHRCSASEGKAIIDAGVAYANALGLRPHADFAKVYPILDDVQAASLPSDLRLGKDGRPANLVGPYDDQSRQLQILAALIHAVGDGNFDWISHLDQFRSGSFCRGWDDIPEEVIDEIGLSMARD